ncbi:nucleotidyltransferase domain-containing protein [Bacillus carboniphilus]|uniref:Nucleotidyltransferase domain-containing protein n=1 Tax=Bacillus carboniphilus TaxID=86663 RepID=A0ABY9JP34_9BACI|nr:nucleotidyltransferase domain-containing protein [Bacillus carboniphilus]WLR41169.1 nucleotidyltransferase domain-containing protein [Bacillus carboniphilus]
MAERLNAYTAAKKFINHYFENCDGAILAGSVVRDKATTTSDLDIVVFDQNIKEAFRESVIQFDWPIELFVHNLQTYKRFFQQDVERARPSLPRMVAEGKVIKSSHLILSIKDEASEIIKRGPAQWSEDTIRLKRYFISDSLIDFIGSTDRQESLFIANKLSIIVHEFVLRTNKQWIGDSKWIIRSLKEYNIAFAEMFVEAFEAFYRNNEKDKVIELVDNVLDPYGGRLFEGFQIGKGT